MNKDSYKSYKIVCENGYYIFSLAKVLEKKNKTMYRLAKELGKEYVVIKRYARGEAIRFDSLILAQICDNLNCQLSDILEYYPNSK